MKETLALTVSRGLFALFTLAVLAVTFYFPLIGFGYATDTSADLPSRGLGLLLLLPSIAMLLFLFGLLPRVRRRLLRWLGLVATLLVLPPTAACVSRGFPAAIGAVIAIG